MDICCYVGEGNGNPLQHSYLENSKDRGPWRATVHGVTNSRTRLSPHAVLSLVLNMTWYNIMGFPDNSVGEESSCNAGNPGLIPGLGRSPGEGKGYPLQYSGLENSMDCIVHGVYSLWSSKSQTRLSDFHFQCNIKLR